MSSAVSEGISLCIPTYNRARLLHATLESIAKIEIPDGVRVEVVVLDNNCTDHTQEVVEQFAPSAPFSIRRIVEIRQGVGHVRTRAIDEAAFDHLGYLDDDIEISAGWVRAYFEAVREMNADCVVGPVRPRFEIPIPDYYTQVVIDSVSSSYTLKGERMMELSGDAAHETPGCNFGVRKATAKEVGGFDPNLDRIGTGLLAGGDFAFGGQLVAGRKRTVYHPALAIQHLITAEKLDPDYLRRRWRGMGATVRAMSVSDRDGIPPLRRRRYLMGIARLRAARAGWRLVGRKDLSFERELQFLKALGFLTGQP